VILADVNVLVYAFRADMEGHARYRDWLESVLNGPEAYGISPQVFCSFLRITTHPRIFVNPSSLAEALEFVRVVQSQPQARVILPGEDHWWIFEALCRESAATGNLVQDAWFAALAIESGCEWITVDRDYARFQGLRWRTPFLAE
jgi:toxin-antitoxin system PIN domain toxin